MKSSNHLAPEPLLFGYYSLDKQNIRKEDFSFGEILLGWKVNHWSFSPFELVPQPL